MKRALSILSVVSLLLASGCGGSSIAGPSVTGVKPSAPEPKHEEAHHANGGASGPMKAPGDANVGDTTKCPISGEEFTVEANSPKVEHAGKTYYFCCGGCKKKFEADPDKYLKTKS